MNQYFTKEGLEELKQKLNFLKTTKKQEIAQRIHSAKELGDLSENAEYIAAKEAQNLNELEIERLESLIKNAKVIAKSGNGKKVEIGSKIKAKNNGKTIEFTIVGSSEASPETGKISNASPLGQSFLGKSKKDKVSVSTPRGKVTYEIVEIH
jgi:transcription elongation factor GreA